MIKMMSDSQLASNCWLLFHSLPSSSTSWQYNGSTTMTDWRISLSTNHKIKHENKSEGKNAQIYIYIYNICRHTNICIAKVLYKSTTNQLLNGKLMTETAGSSMAIHLPAVLLLAVACINLSVCEFNLHVGWHAFAWLAVVR